MLLIGYLSAGFADESPPAESGDRVAATVDGRLIFVRQVEQELKRVFKDRPIDPQAKPYFEAQTLEQLVRRRLILSYLDAKQAGATEEEIERELRRIEKQLGAHNRTLQQHLAAVGLSEDEMREALAWQIGWQRYLDRFLTDKNLQRYFDRRRKHFDGTQFRVAQILIKVDSEADPEAWRKARKQAAAIRSEIENGKISFAEAARKYSESPSGKNGGDIGLISRDKPMPEVFSKAAFDLAKGQISQPVRSKFGLHLIQCVDVKPGDRHWTDVRQELTVAVTKYLFDWASAQQRKHAKIEFTPGVPHFKPGTAELAE